MERAALRALNLNLNLFQFGPEIKIKIKIKIRNQFGRGMALSSSGWLAGSQPEASRTSAPPLINTAALARWQGEEEE